MCQKTTYNHTCTHKVETPLMLCSLSMLPSILHSVNKPKIHLPVVCPSCSVRLNQPTVYPYTVATTAIQPVQSVRLITQPPPQVIHQAPPQVFYPVVPQVIYQQVQPEPYQQTPGSGSYGTPLPVSSTVPRETRQELVGGRWHDIVHYGTPSPAASVRPANIPVDQGWSQVHGLDPGPPPPGPQPTGNEGDASFIARNGRGDPESGPPAYIILEAAAQASLTPGFEARNASAEPFLEMGGSVLGRLTPANITVNAICNGNVNLKENMSALEDSDGRRGDP
ncbi:uncharacterized protein RAG0_14466 [Rhynchosporium agropyri]|uniref:Uncharacterized protein n=1 Tax=Rhynchosporium agropyri TaxID=914238 RepID=A0A1E1LH68_9HELO|nr:uncharacterized protein RAG0_14466 [Rhynchosporium agropyri]